MKKQSFTLATLVLFAAVTFAKTNHGSDHDLKQQSAGISFTENKGQVHDQDDKPRADVLYGIMSGNMAVHIKNNGVSYQLYRVDTYKEVEDPKTKEKRQQADQQTIYRIDLSWLNHNTNFTKTEDDVLPGYNNYYLASCPNGALHVKSYKGITLNNLYNGINLHYYEKNNELKHDYIVAPHADYKQIQLQVEGAEINVNKDGSLMLATPLGKVQEGAPIVYQNARQLKAKWLIKNNILSFEIENYNPGYELIIDPVTRLWGTYYGGTGFENAVFCTADVAGSVYITGQTSSTTTSLIATSGSHQSSYGGSGNSDAFLVKFNANGTRQWGTYYGGSASDEGYSCATDATGNVYMTGYTKSTGVIATTGCYQPGYGGNGDAFLIKFNANGYRQWGTYYGGASIDQGFCCVIDPSNSIYIAGFTKSNSQIANSGSHQPAFGGSGNDDAFLVKFDPNGSRQWGTYYGGTGEDRGSACAVDAGGNVYMTGSTDTNTGTAIAAGGSHQPVFGGGASQDAFLVKFNANGSRQWGTYYGGAGDDLGASCAADASGNIYMTGGTGSNTGTVIATAGSHQSANGGGVSDGYLVKFDANGTRQWGTYYGGTGQDNGSSCIIDATGNIYLAGYADSNTGTVIATAGSYQSACGGSIDGFLVKFNAGGSRQWGTYYGETAGDFIFSCTLDALGNICLAGSTSATTSTVIASAGSHQGSFGGLNDAFLVKFDICDIAPARPSAINGPATVCVSVPVTYSTPVAFGANFYTLSLPTGWSGSVSDNIFLSTPGTSGVFTLIAGNACGVSPQQTLAVTVNPLPVVTVNNGTTCPGQSFTIVAGGAATYSYSEGPVVSPTITSYYMVTGTSTLGCSNVAISTVTVIPSPTVSVNSGSICLGNSFTITPAGASSYTIQGGASVVSPSSTSSYTVVGISAAGCVSSNTAVSNISVNPLPTISASTSNSLICTGESATLTAGGASTYIFNPGETGANIIISPTVTSTYSVTGRSANGCSNTATITQSVNACTGLNSGTLNQASGFFKLYPNPTKRILNLELDSENEIIIINAMGQIVYTSKLSLGNHQINLEDLAEGIYVVKLVNASSSKNIKIIKE